MAHKVMQQGDDWNAIPGTCEQTGNTAPRFPWSTTPAGRFGRIVTLCIAYYLGYTDDEMAKLHRFPKAKEMGDLFNKLLPWFAEHYDAVRLRKAEEQNYRGPMDPLSCEDIRGRTRYCFAKPGSKQHDPKARLYGISTEHPSSTYQRRKGGRGEVFARASTEIFHRLRLGLTFTFAEAEELGQ